MPRHSGSARSASCAALPRSAGSDASEIGSDARRTDAGHRNAMGNALARKKRPSVIACTPQLARAKIAARYCRQVISRSVSSDTPSSRACRASHVVTGEGLRCEDVSRIGGLLLLLEALPLADRRKDNLVARSRRELHDSALVTPPRSALRVVTDCVVLVRLACIEIVRAHEFERGRLGLVGGVGCDAAAGFLCHAQQRQRH